MCRCTEYKLSAVQVRLSEKNKLNATTAQQFITAKISGCALKQWTETHSSLRQSNLQLQNHRLRFSLVKYGQLSIEAVQLDWLAHTLVCKIEFC